jgi:hypothetical protein
MPRQANLSTPPPDTNPVPDRPLRAGRDGTIWILRRNHQKWVALKPINKKGRAVVGYYDETGKRKYLTVSRLVLAAWGDPRPLGFEVYHFPDTNPMNNALSNLRWVPKNTHTVGHRTKPVRGTAHPNAKFSEEDVPAIRGLYRANFSIQEIAEKYQVAQTTIHRILCGKRYANVPDPEGPIVMRVAKVQHPWQVATGKLTWGKVRKIRQLAAATPRPLNRDLAARFDVSIRTISLIINNKSWTV